LSADGPPPRCTPAPVAQLAEEKALDLGHVRHFVVDECDKCLENIDMRADVQVCGAAGCWLLPLSFSLGS
jgi:hypothetical protein